MVNPLDLLKLKPLVQSFRTNHPKVLQFLRAAATTADEGSVVEIKLTTSDGQSIITNMKVTPEDIQLLEELRKLR